jgi:hypothetical protein
VLVATWKGGWKLNDHGPLRVSYETYRFKTRSYEPEPLIVIATHLFISNFLVLLCVTLHDAVDASGRLGCRMLVSDSKLSNLIYNFLL